MGTKANPGPFDAYAKAEPDEPIFVLLGRDPAAGYLVDEWARIAAAGLRKAPKYDSAAPDMRRDAAKIAEAMRIAEAMTRFYNVRNGLELAADDDIAAVAALDEICRRKQKLAEALLFIWNQGRTAAIEHGRSGPRVDPAELVRTFRAMVGSDGA